MFLISLLFFFLSTRPAIATDEFNINQNINYQIDQQGNASVKQEIELINNYSEIYPKEYQIKLSSNKIINVTGSDNEGNIIKNVEILGDSTVINIEFNQSNVGKNKSTKFNLNYYINNLANHKGSTWELPIPDHQDLDSQDLINIEILTPLKFGDLSFSSINPQNIISVNGQTQITFDSNSVKNKKILLIFGNYQLFDFNFRYLINNPSNKVQISEVAIPPQTDNQKIIYKTIEPLPQNIRIDGDGNWLAQYQLQPNQSLDINVSGQAKIIHLNSNKSEINKDLFLKSTEFWQIDNPSIVQIASSLKNPKDIYNYVVKTLNYNYEEINSAQRKGSLDALLSPDKSLCTEFTDLFVTLSRAKGIPAREVEGFAYTNNSKIKPINTNADILHAWPQYYDFNKKAWISIDPTWGKTTNGIDFFNDLDPNHFAFVFHGLDSQNPPPPGAYKNNQDIKTVRVEFAQEEIQAQYSPLKLEIVNQKIYQTPQLKIINPNYNAISNIEISLPSLGWSSKINQIPPLSSETIDMPRISFLQSISPKNLNLKFNIKSTNLNNYQFSIKQPKFYFKITILIALIITIIGIGGIIIHKKK